MVFGLFSKEKALQRTVDKAMNKFAQHLDRQGALYKLLDDGSEDALVGLCKRFSVTASNGKEDLEEKTWVASALVQKDVQALPALRRYMKTAEQLSYPLQVLEKIAPHDKIIEIVDELFATEPPGYARFPDRRIDLIKWFADWKDATDDEVFPRLLPYLVDFDENVRFATIVGLSRVAPDKLVGPLVDALVRPEEESGRIKRTIVEALERTKAPLGDRADDVTKNLVGPLADGFRVDGGIVKKR
jgi:hypothetical protein